jgi:glycosyltransferase involved in cell wall biosynthesis
MNLTVVTNVPAPYRDGVFRELERHTDLRVFLLARDEPGRGWERGPLPYRSTVVPAVKFPGKTGPWYVPLPVWIFRRGLIMVAGYGPPALLTAVARPRSTLVWSEATAWTERGRGGFRSRLRRWLLKRSRAAVAAGLSSRAYAEQLGATTVITLPNVIDVTPTPSSPPWIGAQADSASIVIAHVGDWSLAKGADLVTRVFDLLGTHCAGDPNVSVRLVIAGHVKGDVPLPADATYLGYLPHVDVWEAVHVHSAQYLLLLSRSDTWGFVVPEAIAAGLIPIAAPGVGCSEDLLLPVAPELVCQNLAQVVTTVLRMQSDRRLRQAILSDLQHAARARTSRWAAKSLMSELSQL